jgi:pseudaminic acid cytidylyltransferase
MRVAILPARGGSKRIPRKNVRPFHGLPAIAWPIRAALASGCFDRVLVSTDDDEVAAVARAHGAEVPFRRPPELSGDHVGTTPVVSHAVGWLEASGTPLDAVCCVYATALFLRPSDLQQGLAVLMSGDADYAFSVTRYAFPIQRSLRVNAAGRVEMFQPEHRETRSQDLPEAWHDAGQFYWGKAEAWREGRPVLGPGSAPVPLPRYRVQDIDTPEDWRQAELMFAALSADGS